jgi:hypothetical protein
LVLISSSAHLMSTLPPVIVSGILFHKGDNSHRNPADHHHNPLTITPG